MKGISATVVLGVSVVALSGLLHGAWAVTIDDLQLNEETCRVLRNNAGTSGLEIPCACRLNTGNPVAERCYPSCCPRTTTFEGDRCHDENRREWSVYEQLVCEPRPPAEYTDDTPNCFYKGNDPDLHSVTAAFGKTEVKFSLSLEATHECSNLFIAKCLDERPHWLNGFRLNTSDPRPEFQYCWLPCQPPPLEECTATSCLWHRGKTHAKVHEWSIPSQLPWGDYAVVCQSLMQHVAEGSSLYQDAFSSTFFRIENV